MGLKIELLDCTLRDGSYAIDFQFTPRDTAIIAAALEAAGVHIIEIGHGVGLNASNKGKGVAAATDEEYMQAISEALPSAQWGMFFIPGIGRMQDLDLAASYNMDFVRIGTNVTEIAASRRYIEHAKKLGLFISANLMKSYTMAPEELANNARLSEQYGADMVCLVDSAGCMLPEDVKRYFECLNAVLSIPTGFHGHDNLCMGVANVLTAIECGATRVDATMQGIGRGGGNPVTEVLVAILKKRGIQTGVRLNRLMDISENMIKPLLREQGIDPVNITSGFAGFHSSYLKTVLEYADRYQVDPRDLIVGVCKVDRVHAPEELVKRTAASIKKKKKSHTKSAQIVKLPKVAFDEGRDLIKPKQSLGIAVKKIAGQIRSTAHKSGARAVFNVVAPQQRMGRAVVSRFVQAEFGYVIGSVEVDNATQLAEALRYVDGTVDIIFVDSDRKPYLDRPLAMMAKEIIAKSRVYGYSDNAVWVSSVVRQLDVLLNELFDKKLAVIGLNNLSKKFCIVAAERGARVVVIDKDKTAVDNFLEATVELYKGHPLGIAFEKGHFDALYDCDAVVSFSRQGEISDEMVQEVTRGILLDAGIGAFTADAISAAHAKGMSVIRPDMRAALAAELAAFEGADSIAKSVMGRREIEGISVVAGGVVGEKGAVVVDSAEKPTRVIGIADGAGRVAFHEKAFMDRVRRIEAYIAQKKISGKY